MCTYSLHLTTHGTYKNKDDDDDNDKNGDSVHFQYINVLSQSQVAFNSNSTTRKITKNCITQEQWWWWWWWYSNSSSTNSSKFVLPCYTITCTCSQNLNLLSVALWIRTVARPVWCRKKNFIENFRISLWQFVTFCDSLWQFVTVSHQTSLS